MGSLSHFDVRGLTERYGCTLFAETGTGTGEGLATALAAGVLDPCCSVEINERLWQQARTRFSGDQRAALLLGPSTEGIKDILHVFGKAKILWWLDAHFPGADYGLAAYDAEPRDAVRMPLREELELIKGRPGGGAGDVILIDDARLFLTVGGWGAGNLDGKYRTLVPPSLTGSYWIRDLFSDTHTLSIDYTDQGYIALLPRGV